MSESERRREYHHNRILIETARILSPSFDDAVVFLSGAQIEMVRNVSQYLNRQETYVTEYNPGYYLMPTVADYDDILEIVADLEETLMGNPNTIFGYSDQINVNMTEIKSGDGTYSKLTGTVPAGKIWLLQHITFQNSSGVRGLAYMRIQWATESHYLWYDSNPGQSVHNWDGCITLKQGDYVAVRQFSCLDGDSMKAGVIANEMDVPT